MAAGVSRFRDTFAVRGGGGSNGDAMTLLAHTKQRVVLSES